MNISIVVTSHQFPEAFVPFIKICLLKHELANFRLTQVLCAFHEGHLLSYVFMSRSIPVATFWHVKFGNVIY